MPPSMSILLNGLNIVTVLTDSGTYTVRPRCIRVHPCNPGIVNRGTIHILGWIILCCGRAALFIICCSRAPWASTCYMPGAQHRPPNCDNQKCLQMLPSVPWRAKRSPVEKPLKLNWMLGFWNQLMLKDPLKNSHMKKWYWGYYLLHYSLLSIMRAHWRNLSQTSV